MSDVAKPLLGFAIIAGFLVSGVWTLVIAFRHSLGWGFACMLVPFAAPIFVVNHWSAVRKPFMLHHFTWFLVSWFALDVTIFQSRYADLLESQSELSGDESSKHEQKRTVVLCRVRCS